ncbi:MAG TPA: penicillin acylase family protein, partial [Myxococcota bacterium]|nr:penicillin acylase family protein [Myxococcota bacterium]
MLLALALACAPAGPSLLDVPETARFPVPGLGADVQVLRTEADVPHVYAADDVDAARAVGFLYAKDRFFLLDVARRLGGGRLSGLLGDLALEADATSRLQGMAEVAAGLDTLA